MRLIKSIGSAACIALVATAFVSVSSAAAEFHVESCDKNGCKTASVGTTFTAYTTKVMLANPFFVNTCEGEVEGTVVSTLATATQEIDADIDNAEFFNCDVAQPILVFGLPWLLTTSLSLFANDQTGLVSGGVLVKVDNVPVVGSCTYTETTKDVVFGDWVNGNPSSFVLLGSLERENSNFLCGLASVSSLGFFIISVTDPNLPAAENIRIQ